MTLLTILRKNKQKEKEMRLLMLGLDNAGKTTILKRMNGEPIDTLSPTLGFNIKTMQHPPYTLNIWDVGGQKTIRSYWKNYYEQTDGLVWIVDSADKDASRWDICKQELHALLLEERLAGASLLILANKQDLPSALNCQDIQQRLDLDTIQTHHWTILPCSAVSGDNLVKGIDWIVSDISSRIFLLD